MKGLFLVILIFCFASSGLICQIEKGDRIVSYLSSPNATFGNFAPLLANDNFQLAAFPEVETGLLVTGIDYRFALADGLLLGSGISYIRTLNSFQNINALTLRPSVRYYFLSNELKGIFAEGGVQRSFGRNIESRFNFDLKVGHQWAFTRGILLTVSADYNINSGTNSLLLGAGVEFLLTPGDNSQKESWGFKKGDLMIGTGIVDIRFQENAFAFQLQPVVYRFLADETALGVGVAIGMTRQKLFSAFGGDVIVQEINFGLDVRLRQYFGAPRRLQPFGELSAGGSAGILSTKFDNSQANSSGNEFEGVFGIGAGAQFFVRENFALEFGPEFRYYTEELNGTGTLSLNLGARWRLNR